MLMAAILRKVVNKAHFFRQEGLKDNDAQADAFASLKTSGNLLSVWIIDDDRSNLNRVIAALAAGRDFLDKLDYALIDEAAIDDIGIHFNHADGNTPDEGANQRWHQDLAGLTGQRLVALAAKMHGSNMARVPKRGVRDLILESIDSGFFAKESLKDKLRENLS